MFGIGEGEELEDGLGLVGGRREGAREIAGGEGDGDRRLSRELEGGFISDSSDDDDRR